ncbi:uncharacterized protein BDW43DRAFT_315402 [Aspergillus alliaceus]|uniref:uncharacterized protein n=1 Tax=Petromyces alliaceus TaxID=209559 RepID=UPI0012A53360|nr:uncharacterized protein BDW43DRAFT_315402 [Aspergillus alliaceus]KAB8228901.1 hypothetical protein BDW43DRAFT_315402 [Aspergillus alliaceus]
MAAAKIMLDEIHPSLRQPKSDHNVYTLGSISSHNVVVACLPAGVYGTTSAAIVLAHMLPTFPSLQFALMVGIGGGVPSKKADIRLGDVVVSMPTPTSGGVIQYDYGKTLHDGHFQRTGSLNKPPQVLLAAVSQIRSDNMIKKLSIGVIISDVLQIYENCQQFSHPDQDWLFNSTYDHQSRRPSCSTCDQTQLVHRAPRETNEPHIHYGLIASGNQVMKDAKRRDLIAQDIDILCFEMEAAGLMDQLPCLVIRGICDYCDSHKHKQWQGYAALTAAAYAKLLLSAVPIIDYKPLREQSAELTAEEKACLQCLFITDPVDDKNALKRRKGERVPGTCDWILETDELTHWLGLHKNISKIKSNILWLYGLPGTGKSTMAITLTEELPNQTDFINGNKRLAYFFCDSSSKNQRTATAILRGLLYQLIQKHRHLMKYLLPKYIARKGQILTSFDALWSTLMDMGQDSSSSGIYCIIDALDECEYEDQQTLLRHLDQTFNNCNPKRHSLPNLYFLITSRQYPEIEERLAHFPCQNLAKYSAVADDLKAMIQERVNKLSTRKKYPKAVTAEVSRILEEKAGGTFLWVGIACDELEQVQARSTIGALQNLPRGLHALYQRLLETAVATSSENDKPIIMDLVSFVAIAQRPLTISELSEACQLYLDEDEDSRLQFTRDVINLCRLIIVIQGEQVRLLHKSVRDFLVEAAKVNELRSHAILANRCITYVIRFCQLQVNNSPAEPRSKFLKYSVLCWPEHAGLAREEFLVKQEQIELFQVRSRAWEDWLGHYNSQLDFLPSSRLAAGFSIFHAAARWKIDPLISWAMHTFVADVYIDSDFKTLDGVTPLEEAARYGNICAFGTLLKGMPMEVAIEARVVNAAARSPYGNGVIRLLLEQRGDQVQITEDVVKAAAGNLYHGKEVMALLLEQRGDQVQITEDMVKVAAGNKGDGKEVMAFLLEQRGDQVQITDDVVKAAAGNEDNGKEVMALLLKQRGDQVQITEDMVKVAAGNKGDGKEIMALLLEQRGDQVQITEDVVKAAAGNEDNGKEVMALLLEQRGDQVQITEDVVKEAAGNR